MAKKIKTYRVFAEIPGNGWEETLRAFTPEAALRRANKMHPLQPTTMCSVEETSRPTSDRTTVEKLEVIDF